MAISPRSKGSKHLRDTESGVRVEFLVSGQFPGDGKPKPVAFPEPAAVSIEKDGIKYLTLPALIELKLASGMTNAQRLKDLSDVMELIKLLGLRPDFKQQLAPFVQEKYLEMCKSIAAAPKRYLKLWRNQFLTVDATSIDEMIDSLRDALRTLEAMRADGVALEATAGTADSYLVTFDPLVARKYDMHDEEGICLPPRPCWNFQLVFSREAATWCSPGREPGEKAPGKKPRRGDGSPGR